MAIGTGALDALYKRLKPKGVTMTALLAKATGVALAGHPLLYACERAARPLRRLFRGCGLACVDGGRTGVAPAGTCRSTQVRPRRLVGRGGRCCGSVYCGCVGAAVGDMRSGGAAAGDPWGACALRVLRGRLCGRLAPLHPPPPSPSPQPACVQLRPPTAAA
jgi:hypothetical protein